MKITMIACDNPPCAATGEPEHIGRTTHMPPYGWLRVNARIQGTGPAVTVDVCSTACVEGALDNAIQEAQC